MTPVEIGMLLAKAAAYDARTVGKADVAAWHEALHMLDYGDAMAALVDHFRESTERLMPVHINRRVKAMRAERLTGIDAVELAPDVDTANVALWLETIRKRRDDIAAGRVDGKALRRAIEAEYAAQAVTWEQRKALTDGEAAA